MAKKDPKKIQMVLMVIITSRVLFHITLFYLRIISHTMNVHTYKANQYSTVYLLNPHFWIVSPRVCVCVCVCGCVAECLDDVNLICIWLTGCKRRVLCLIASEPQHNSMFSPWLILISVDGSWMYMISETYSCVSADFLSLSDSLSLCQLANELPDYHTGNHDLLLSMCSL